MNAYAVFYTYAAEHADERKRLLEDHRAWLRDFDDSDRVIGAGIYPDGTGALLIFLAEDRTTFEQELRKDPFANAGLVESVLVRHWTPNWGPVAEVVARS